ncbi:glycosyltransferase family 2 protein [Candidatus Pelagibacter communis]|uniref:glycosyltransferase family 2 protein n=1 Tax=Pelagibacter ubique TaxID=198252 RepID=UPI00094D948A|nr:glycosyltransferase family 2 protein [Candidatus Pelagibacter ubique]
MKLISVIIPYYKKKDFIKKTLLSVINQSYKNFEILLVYDDETKEDLSYIKNISKMDTRIKLIVNKKNLGAGMSRNKAIKFSKGEFLAFIDADDIWKKKKLEKQINFMIKKKAAISHTSYVIINNKNKILKVRKAKKISTHQNLLEDCDIGCSTVILKKKIISKKIKFPNLKTKEDFVLWLNLSKKYTIYGLDKKLTMWRNLDNSLSKNVSQKIFDGYKVYRNYMGFGIFKSIKYLYLLSFNFLKKNYLYT